MTRSASLYSLRCLIEKDLPLNDGCLIPIRIHIPKGSLLDPSTEAAVVGGNVLTSQRVVDVILKAFGVVAASQGCMNNFTFGNDRFGYYETIAGGAGASPTWDGQTGVHTHMTNTRITDPEILERRYPILLREFSIRHGSGGAGRHRGGDGWYARSSSSRPSTWRSSPNDASLRPMAWKAASRANAARIFLSTGTATGSAWGPRTKSSPIPATGSVSSRRVGVGLGKKPALPKNNLSDTVTAYL